MPKPVEYGSTIAFHLPFRLILARPGIFVIKSGATTPPGVRSCIAVLRAAPALANAMTADKMSNNPDDGDGNLRERNTPLAPDAIIGCAKMNDILGAMARVGSLRRKPNLRRKRLTSGDGGAKVRKRCWFETGCMALLPDKDADLAY